MIVAEIRRCGGLSVLAGIIGSLNNSASSLSRSIFSKFERAAIGSNREPIGAALRPYASRHYRAVVTRS
jgi:hypothetical protein